MVKYLELLEVTRKGLGESRTVFDRICTYVGKEFQFLEDQMRTECKAQRGELPVERYIRVETRHVIDDEFAGAMRSDRDRQEFENLIGARIQVNKEVYIYFQYSKYTVTYMYNAQQKVKIMPKLRSSTGTHNFNKCL